MLYIGYVGMAIPFAFVLSSLIRGQLDSTWLRWSRPWTLMAWAFLTFGITLGSWWAYYELGWGGWWFWDNIGGWIIKPKSCNNGFNSRPCVGMISRRSNGLEVNNKNNKKPTLISPNIIKIWFSTSDGKRLEKIDTATHQTDNINVHNNKEPSCAPQTADILKRSGN
jgi:hypothetical protein